MYPQGVLGPKKAIPSNARPAAILNPRSIGCSLTAKMLTTMNLLILHGRLPVEMQDDPARIRSIGTDLARAEARYQGDRLDFDRRIEQMEQQLAKHRQIVDL